MEENLKTSAKYLTMVLIAALTMVVPFQRRDG